MKYSMHIKRFIFVQISILKERCYFSLIIVREISMKRIIRHFVIICKNQQENFSKFREIVKTILYFLFRVSQNENNLQ
jgi:hypothetical protein